MGEDGNVKGSGGGQGEVEKNATRRGKDWRRDGGMGRCGGRRSRVEIKKGERVCVRVSATDRTQRQSILRCV